MMKEKHIALARECERLARQAEANMLNPDLNEAQKSEQQELARVYWQAAQGWTESALFAEEARPAKFTGRAKGERKKTVEMREFLKGISEKIGSSNHEAIAAEALETYKSRVRTLWRAEGERARRKILDFLRNHSI